MPARGRSRPERDAGAPPVLPRRPARLGARPATRAGPDLTGARLAGPSQPAFAQTPDFTVGVEEELQLVDPDEGHLVDRPEEIQAAMDASDGRLQAEVFSSTVETTTPVCADVVQMTEQMRRLRSWVVDAAEDHGLAVAASGTHPFATWETEATTKTPRYDELVRELQLPMRSDLVFGQHVHVSVGTAQEAIRVTNDIHAFLPLLVALSANAPFWRGLDTGLQSARLNVSAGMPRSGLPPVFDDWEAFGTHIRRLAQVGAVEDVTKIWWDVRPRPDLGTVEVRIADLPTEIEHSVALAAFTHALVVHLAKASRRGERPPIRHPPEIVRENRWRAVRHGLDAAFIDPAPEARVQLRSVDETLETTLEALEPTLRRLDVEDETDHLRSLVEGNRSGADRQRAVYAREGTLSAVVRDLADRTAL